MQWTIIYDIIYVYLLRSGRTLVCYTQAEDINSSVENTLYDIYDSQKPLINEKLQELYAALDRIAKLETEIQEFKQSLACLYQDTIDSS